jgi:hypothetical protein
MLNDNWVMEEIMEEIENLLESKENENTNYQNLWDISKAILRRKYIRISSYIKKIVTSQINNLMMYLKLLENKIKSNPRLGDGEK